MFFSYSGAIYAKLGHSCNQNTARSESQITTRAHPVSLIETKCKRNKNDNINYSINDYIKIQYKLSLRGNRHCFETRYTDAVRKRKHG